MSFRNPTHFCAFVLSFFAISFAGRAHGSCAKANPTKPAGIAAATTIEAGSAQASDDLSVSAFLQPPAHSILAPVLSTSVQSKDVSDSGARDFVVRAGLSPPEVIA